MPQSVMQLLTMLTAHGARDSVLMMIILLVLGTAAVMVLFRGFVRLRPSQRQDVIALVKAIRRRRGRRGDRS